MRSRFLMIAFLICSVAFSQNGTVAGKITDKDLNNEALPFASVTLKGTTTGTSTDADGKYSLSVAPGDHILIISFVGYETVEVPFSAKANETTVIDKAIGSGSVKLEDIVVTTTASRQKETALLLEQKNAVEIKQNIGAQELSRKGVSDVATAVTKTTGITKQEGSGNIFVRGLGDRYNATTMNGLPVPSNDPEKKNLNLEIFSTDIVEYVSIDKVYSSRLFGDFAGGNVDIISKDYKGNGFLRLEVGAKANTNAVGEDHFSLRKGYGFSGFDTSSIPSNSLNQFGFKTLQMEEKNPFAGSLNLSGGKSFNIGETGKLSFFATAGFSNDYSSRSDGSAKSGVNGAGVANKNFSKYTFLSYDTNTTGMLNIGYKIDNANKINLNSVYINSSTQSQENYFGYIVDIAEDGNGTTRRFNYEKNSLWINQLLGDHKIGDRSKLNWGLSYNTIKADMPDRVQNIFRKEVNGYVLSSVSVPDNHRYFQNLEENELAASISFDYKFAKNADNDYKGKVTIGANSRVKSRDFEATQFNFKVKNEFRNTIVDPENLDLFYNQQNLSDGIFEITTFRGNSQVSGATKPQTYNGDQTVNAGFIQAEYKFNKLTASLGLRGENITQKVKWDTQLGSIGNDKLDKFAFLPSLILKYELNEKQNLRLGFSKTYTLPQFKERALFVYEEVLQVKVGNPFLYESDDYNLDLKWEMFPKSEELISLTVFGKYIQNPINEVTIASTTNDISFLNTGDSGFAAGAEVEYRKQILNFGETNAKKLSAGINASYLHTEQDLDPEKVKRETDYEAEFTYSKSRFTGASDILLNADVTFFNEWNEKNANLTTTVAYNYFSDRVYAIGTRGAGDLVDKAFGSLDFIAKAKLNKSLGLSFIAKNLLDPSIDRVQENKSGDVNVLSYKKGMVFSLSVNYQF